MRFHSSPRSFQLRSFLFLFSNLMRRRSLAPSVHRLHFCFFFLLFRVRISSITYTRTISDTRSSTAHVTKSYNQGLNSSRTKLNLRVRARFKDHRLHPDLERSNKTSGGHQATPSTLVFRRDALECRLVLLKERRWRHDAVG